MKKIKLSRRVFSAFTLRDDQTWEQPSFRVRVLGQAVDGECAVGRKQRLLY